MSLMTYCLVVNGEINFICIFTILTDLNINAANDKVRLAPEKESLELTGFEHNGVTCIGMKTDIPVIMILLCSSIILVLIYLFFFK